MLQYKTMAKLSVTNRPTGSIPGHQSQLLWLLTRILTTRRLVYRTGCRVSRSSFAATLSALFTMPSFNDKNVPGSNLQNNNLRIASKIYLSIAESIGPIGYNHIVCHCYDFIQWLNWLDYFYCHQCCNSPSFSRIRLTCLLESSVCFLWLILLIMSVNESVDSVLTGHCFIDNRQTASNQNVQSHFFVF